MEQFVIVSHYKIDSHDKLTTYAVFPWFTLFWRNTRFVRINAVLCEGKINSTFLSVEQRWQTWRHGSTLLLQIEQQHSSLSVVFSCPEQLNRWPCHWLTNSTFTFDIHRATLETCDLWDIIPDICHFWYATIIFRPVKGTPKKCVNSRQKFPRDKTA